MRKRVIIGAFLILGAAAQAGLAWHLSNIAADNERLAATAWTKADSLCRAAVSGVGEVSEAGTQLVVNRTLLPGEDWRVALMDASSVISHCATRRMTYFCMGRACGEVTDRAATLTNLEEQDVAPTASEILRTEPVKILFRLQEVRS
jgi:hypothetical protein